MGERKEREREKKEEKGRELLATLVVEKYGGWQFLAFRSSSFKSHIKIE